MNQQQHRPTTSTPSQTSRPVHGRPVESLQTQRDARRALTHRI